MAIQMSTQSARSLESHTRYSQEPQAEDFMQAPVYPQKILAAAVSKAGFRAFRVHMLPAALYSGGQQVACIKYFCGFITLRQGPEEPYRHLSEMSEWNRVILAIHDFRHEYLLRSVSNDALVAEARSRLRRNLTAWIDSVPRLKHRLTVGVIPNTGLVTIESHQINGRPDMDALAIFLAQYLEQDHLTSDITAAFTGHEPYDIAPVQVEPSWLHKHFIGPLLARWYSVPAVPGNS